MSVRTARPRSPTPDLWSGEWGTMLRSVIAVTAALLVAILVVRNAAVMALADTRPAAAAQFWSSHPQTDLSTAMTGIARAARDRRPVPASAFATMADVAAKDPLAPEPFLVRGVQAQLSGDGVTAQKAFEAAQWRDPRSLPAAYFLADRYLRVGEIARGLNEVGTLARLSPYGPATIGPYLAAYAKDPATWPELRRLFQANPGLASPTLVALASRIDTAPAVLELAGPYEKGVEPQWLAPLLTTLTGAGEYAKARAIWGRATGVTSDQLLYDSAFADRASPPPFNWTLTTSAVGLAERQPGGRLHIVYYGQEDGFLATQLVLLPPGSYRLSMQLLGDPARARALSWSIWCDKAPQALSSASLNAVAAHGLQFQVPSGCEAQWVKLAGVSSDISQQSDVTIAALKLEKAVPGA
jgi:hypothetical protein